MASNEVKAAIEAQQLKGITKMDPISLPGFGPSQEADTDLNKYHMRYTKIDLDDPASIAELEILETRAIHNKGIFIMSKEKYNFMDKLFIVVGYLEQIIEAPKTRSGLLEEVSRAELASKT